MEKTDLDKLVEEVVRWAESPEGRRSLEEAHRRAEETVKKLQEARRVPWERMMEPMTI